VDIATKDENFSKKEILIWITMRILPSSRNVGPAPFMQI
jgi:hypothetical protein